MLTSFGALTVPIFCVEHCCEMVFVKERRNFEESPLGFTSNDSEKRILVVKKHGLSDRKWYQRVCRYWIWFVLYWGMIPFLHGLGWFSPENRFALERVACCNWNANAADFLLISNLLLKNFRHLGYARERDPNWELIIDLPLFAHIFFDSN